MQWLRLISAIWKVRRLFPLNQIAIKQVSCDAAMGDMVDINSGMSTKSVMWVDNSVQRIPDSKTATNCGRGSERVDSDVAFPSREIKGCNWQILIIIDLVVVWFYSAS